MEISYYKKLKEDFKKYGIKLNMTNVDSSIAELEIIEKQLKNDLSKDKTDLLYSAAYFTVLALSNGIESVSYNSFSEQEEMMISKTIGLIIEEMENSNQ